MQGADPASRLTQLALPNGLDSDFTYDLDGRLDSLAYMQGAVELERFDYAYDGLGNITQIAELSQTKDFTYDLLQRLTAGGTVAAPESYAYDPEGNRTNSHLSALHVVDDANRLSEDDDYSYLYDLNGNLESKTHKVTLDVTSYSYDAQNQLTRIDLPGGSVALYKYDALGRRIEKDLDGTVTRWLYDGEDILIEFDGAGATLARYSHGPGRDMPLAVERGANTYYYQADHQGSIRRLTDAAGSIVNAYDYDAYGNFTLQSESIPQPYAYTGREHDPESGLLYYRARYYDPATGRFLQEDPIGFSAGDLNLYAYVFNNPVNSRDPSGRLVILVDNGRGGLGPKPVTRAIYDFLRDLFRRNQYCEVAPGFPGEVFDNGFGNEVYNEEVEGAQTGDEAAERLKEGSQDVTNEGALEESYKRPPGSDPMQDLQDIAGDAPIEDLGKGKAQVKLPKSGDATYYPEASSTGGPTIQVNTENGPNVKFRY